MASPCPWWTPELATARRAWLEAPVPMPVPYEQLDPCRQWCAGQPVLLRSSGHEHLVWVRLNCNASFGKRWLSGSIPDQRVSLTELSTRDPRQVWKRPFELQLAIALLSSGAGYDTRCAWLRDIDEESEPALFDLLLLAEEEMGHRTEHAPNSWTAKPQEPRPTRGWTKTELERLRVPEGVVEPVLAAAS